MRSSAERYEVGADAAEAEGRSELARSLAREAGWQYERVAKQTEMLSAGLAADFYRSAARCYARGASSRSETMLLRAARLDIEQAKSAAS